MTIPDTLPDRLKNIIQDDAHIQLTNSHSSKTASLIIKETDPRATLKQVTLNGLSAHASFAFKLDCKKIRWGKKHKLSPYFKDGKDLDKGCDAIIITQIKSQQSQWHIFIVELKSTSKQKIGEIHKQFKSSVCFVKYIQAILRTMYENNDINNVKLHCVLFSNDASNLRGTKHNSISPEKIDGISIKHLRATKECSILKLA